MPLTETNVKYPPVVQQRPQQAPPTGPKTAFRIRRHHVTTGSSSALHHDLVHDCVGTTRPLSFPTHARNAQRLFAPHFPCTRLYCLHWFAPMLFFFSINYRKTKYKLWILECLAAGALSASQVGVFFFGPILRLVPNRLLINSFSSRYERAKNMPVIQLMPDPSEFVCTAPNPCMHTIHTVTYITSHTYTPLFFFMYAPRACSGDMFDPDHHDRLCVDGVRRQRPQEVTALSGLFFPFFFFFRLRIESLLPTLPMPPFLFLFSSFQRANYHVPPRATAVRRFAARQLQGAQASSAIPRSKQRQLVMHA